MIKRLGIALALALALTLSLGSVALADDPFLTATWNMTNGTVLYNQTSDPGPSNTDNIAHVTTSLTVTGQSSGYITTTNTPYVGAPYYGTYQLVQEKLVATGFDSGQALDYTFNANDDVYNRNPPTGFQLDADAWGNYNVDIESKHGDSATEVGLDLNMQIPAGGGQATATVQQGTVNTAMASLAVNSPGSGSLTMVKPIAYNQYLGYTFFGDVSASGGGGSMLFQGSTPGNLDFKAVGSVDGIVVFPPGINMDDVQNLSVGGGFSNTMDFRDNWSAHLVSPPGVGGYWPSRYMGREWEWVGYEFAFDGTLK